MAKKEVNVGDKAPLFKLDSYNSGTIDLAQLIGKQKIVLIFSRYFGCPICQLDLSELLSKLQEIEAKGAKLIYITQSGPEKSKTFIEEKHIKFPVVMSSKEALYAEYGLGMLTMGAMAKLPGKLKAAKKAGFEHGEFEGWEKQCPGQFVIDQEGKITHAKKGWLDIDDILAAL